MDAAVAVAFLAFLAALGGIGAQVWTLYRQERQQQRAATALLVREIAVGPESQPHHRRDAWFRMKGASVETLPAVDAYALEDYDSTLRSAAAQWAIDQMGFSGYEVFGQLDGAKRAQWAADVFDKTHWRISFFCGTELVEAESEADARTEFLFQLGEPREANPSDQRILNALSKKVDLSDDRWADVADSELPGGPFTQPRTVASLRNRTGQELLGEHRDGALIAGRLVSQHESKESVRQAEHSQIRAQFLRFPLRIQGPFIPTRHMPI